MSKKVIINLSVHHRKYGIFAVTAMLQPLLEAAGRIS